MSLPSPVIPLASAGLGIGLLRLAWVRRGDGRLLTIAAWLVLLGGIYAWYSTGVAWDEATALAALAPSLIAFALLARHAEWRTARPNAPRTREPTVLEPRASESLTRDLSRVIVAGPLALAAALGFAAVIALHAPAIEANRLVTAELCLPLLWAAAAVWATMADNLQRVAVVLALATVTFLGGAVL